MPPMMRRPLLGVERSATRCYARNCGVHRLERIAWAPPRPWSWHPQRVVGCNALNGTATGQAPESSARRSVPDSLFESLAALQDELELQRAEAEAQPYNDEPALPDPKAGGEENLHPRDYFMTVYGRKPVLEALKDESLRVDKLLVARGVRGELISDILRLADLRGIIPKRCNIESVHRFSGSPRQDQGVVLDLIQPKMFLQDYLRSLKTLPREPIVLLDNVRNAQNVGMILRSATAAGATATVIPRKGTPGLGPLVIKASAGVALKSNIIHCEDAETAAIQLKEHGFRLMGLSGSRDAVELYSQDEESIPGVGTVWVLGNESEGISNGVSHQIDRWVKIPMEAGVESLNVATAASVVLFELMRRRRS